ncbi:FkbM family methyltransferase [Mariprofundus sp. EBB-1]|uniref:FkbM family methyltransferase n=1 Tax=Mariprofundus sp. EBB-1 TaxID=2650971 RepID=UPI0013793C05|nr:FkbM family methyltransferase [Mariprofundus sp. EBB-1]
MNKKQVQTHKLINDISQLYTRGLYSDAELLCKRALALEPDNIPIHLLYARSLYNQLKPQESIPLLEQAIKLAPDNEDVRTLLMASYIDSSNLPKMIELSDIFQNQPRNNNELILAYRCYLSACDWDSAAKLENEMLLATSENNPDHEVLPALLLALNGRPNISPELDFQLHREWGKSNPNVPEIRPPKVQGRIRIAYISGDFYRHPVAYFMHQIIPAHNRDEFEVYCFAHLSGREDDLTKQFIEDSDQFFDITNMNNKALHDLMRTHNIHIAIDLSGHTTCSRTAAFALRLAPVQISYLGYPNTTGLEAMDFHITDPFCEDENHGTQYIEKLLTMPKTFLNYGVSWDLKRSENAPCIEKGYITFGSFNNGRKINLEVVEVWSSILSQVKHSRMHLKFPGCDYDLIQKNLYKAFAKFGIESSRITTLSRTSLEEHMLGYNDIDIALDTFPYTGTTTTCEALAMGVPVVTLVGAKHANRVSYSILKNIGFESTIAFSNQEYIEKAVNLAGNPEGLRIIRSSLPILLQHSPVKQIHPFINDLENLYKEACHKKGLDLSEIEQPSDNTLEQQNDPLPTRSAHDNSASSTINMLDGTTDMQEQEVKSISTSLTLSINGGIQIVVPNDLNLMTPYVLTEQQDWFEDEIIFIRKIIKSGMKVVDIGANYGCYSMTFSSLVGDKGHLWAFEPANSTVSFLKESIKINHFKQVTLIKAALSNREGTAELLLQANSELNSISTSGSSNSARESVPLKRLDDCIKSYQWRDIAFVKLDAEGEEIRILEGGQEFFSRFSPLVMFELKHGDQVNEGLIQKFESMDYHSFVLTPGIQILTPFSPDEHQDIYLLNLFCCKEDRAKQLADDGFLILKVDDNCDSPTTRWQQHLANFPYASELIDPWQSQQPEEHPEGWEIYELALNQYASAQASDQPATKLSHLQQSFINMVSLLDIHVSIPRLMTLTRIASELGHRGVAVQVLNQIAQHLEQEKIFIPSEPFLAVSSTAEHLNPDNRLLDWSLATVLASKEKRQAFSSYFTGQSSLPEIERFLSLGFHDEEMIRRKDLIRQRFQPGAILT